MASKSKNWVQTVAMTFYFYGVPNILFFCVTDLILILLKSLFTAEQSTSSSAAIPAVCQQVEEFTRESTHWDASFLLKTYDLYNNVYNEFVLQICHNILSDSVKKKKILSEMIRFFLH